MNNGFKDKAYIGIVDNPDDKEADIKEILKFGTPFPFEQAIIMTGGKWVIKNVHVDEKSKKEIFISLE